MLTLPMFPMRPVSGEKLTTSNVLYVISQYKAKGYLLQPKLNGDRAIFEMKKDRYALWNRYGGKYSASPVECGSWLTLPAGTLLDGEVWRKKFYAFECLATSTMDLTVLGTIDRIAYAESLSRGTGNPFLFSEPSNDWLITESMNTEIKTVRKWEGVVAKLAHVPYRAMKTPDQDSPEWTKLKWA